MSNIKDRISKLLYNQGNFEKSFKKHSDYSIYYYQNQRSYTWSQVCELISKRKNKMIDNIIKIAKEV